jgi:hypothetical protein
MTMLASKIPILAEMLEEYYEPGELQEVAKLFGVDLAIQTWSPTKQEWLAIARQLVENLEQGNHHALLQTLLEQLDIRNTTAIAHTDWERRAAHQALAPTIAALRLAFAEAAAPAEIAVSQGSPFSAKSQIRDLLATASTEVLVVDPYVGVGTLDCLRSVRQRIRLLTASLSNSVEAGFDAALSDFQKEGFHIEVRRADMLHDRHLVFNGRCWLVGSSLKDAGKKAFHCMEIVDLKAQVVSSLEAKWSISRPYP